MRILFRLWGPRVCLGLLASCTGTVGSKDNTKPPEEKPSEIGVENGPRRLSRRELVRSFDSLFSVDIRAEVTDFDLNTLFEGAPKLFFYDGYYPQQQTPLDFLLAVDELATKVAATATSTPARMNALVGCSSADAACLEQFVARVGRRALRRPLTAEEQASLTTEAMKWVAPADAPPSASKGFANAVAFVIRALASHPEFLFLSEAAPTQPGALLSDFEIASRLSLLLWGQVPDDTLLDAAVAGQLHTPEAVRAQAERMLRDPKALAQLEDFHGYWLNFGRVESVVSADLAKSMREETRALLSRTIFEQNKPYIELFTSPDTYVDEALAKVYGLTTPPSGKRQWIAYPADSGRGGILSHGSVLATSGPGSATYRGLFVREHLLCTPLKTPKDLMVNFDAINDPNLGRCKSERLKKHADGGCKSCHAQIDPLGFGLLRYNGLGAYQTAEPDKPDCPYPEDGSLVLGSESLPFRGPKQLGAHLATRPEFISCLSQQYFRFSVGRLDVDADSARITGLNEALTRNGNRFVPALVDWVGQPSFLKRRTDLIADDVPAEE
jgi:hypothetical protein